ncbi:hypothetical protein [Sporomusa carbonis]
MVIKNINSCHKENTACAEPLAKAEADVALILAESYTFCQDNKNQRYTS